MTKLQIKIKRILKNLENYVKLWSKNIKSTFKKIIKYVKILSKKNMRKFNFSIKNTFGYNIAYLVDNYFSASFLLVNLKLILSLFMLKITIIVNLAILIILWIMSIKFNVYQKLRNAYINLLTKIISEIVTDQFDGLDEEMVEKKCTIINNISFYCVFFLVGIRIFIQEHLIIYIVSNFLFIQFLLSNVTFGGLVYVYMLIIMISRLTLYLHLKQSNYSEFKHGLRFYEQQLLKSEVGIKVSYNNLYILTYWCVRDIETINRFYTANPTDERLEMFYDGFLQVKYDEQEYQGFNHKLPGNEPKIEVYQKRLRIYSYLIFVSVDRLFNIICPQWKSINQFKGAEGHMCWVNICEYTKQIKVVIGTTWYKNQPYPKQLLHSTLLSEYEYKPGKIQAVADRQIIFMENEYPKDLLKKIPVLEDISTYTHIQLQTINNLKLARPTIDQNLLKNTYGGVLISETGIIRKYRNLLEDMRYLKSPQEILKPCHKPLISPETYGEKTSVKGLLELRKAKAEYQTPLITKCFDCADVMQKNILLKETQIVSVKNEKEIITADFFL